MKRVLTLIFSLAVSQAALAGELQASYRYTSADADARQEKFLAHTGTGMGSYLAMNVPFAPVDFIRQQAAADLEIKLQSRGEAHVTVLTPVEFSQVLAKYVSIEELNRLAAEQRIQAAFLEPVCLAQAQRGNLRTLFILIRSEDLLRIRRAIHALYVAKGGAPQVFDPERFYPHITVGFVGRDLHEQDGVIKDARLCEAELAN